MMPIHSRAVAIVGGGIFGAAIAFRLARSGCAVTVIERDEPGAHASGRNAGHLSPLHLTPESLVPFALASFRLHEQLRQTLTIQGHGGCGWEPIRRIVVAFEPHETAEFTVIERRHAAHAGFTARRLDAPAMRQLEPRISRRAVAGLLLEGSISVDGRSLTRSLVRAAVDHGARVVRASATGIVARGRTVAAVRTGAGEVPCDHAVFATGAWVDGPAAWLGARLDIRPVQGQLVRGRLPGGIACDLVHGDAAVYRRGEDEVWIGGTQAHAGLDESPTEAARTRLLAGAERLMPGLARVEVLEQTCGLRPTARDRMPIVFRPPSWTNVIVANGGGSKGVLLATGVAESVAAALGVPDAFTIPLPIAA